MSGAIGSLGGGALAAIVKAILEAIFGARENAAARADNNSAHERAGAAEAGNETQQTIAEIADERSKLPSGPDTPADLARRMRERAAGLRANGGDRPS